MPLYSIKVNEMKAKAFTYAHFGKECAQLLDVRNLFTSRRCGEVVINRKNNNLKNQ